MIRENYSFLIVSRRIEVGVLLLMLFLFGSFVLQADQALALHIVWDRVWGVPVTNQATAGIAADVSGNTYVLTGDYYFYKYDRNGNQLWTSASSGFTNQTELILVGNYIYVSGRGSSDILGAKFDLSGNLIATYSYDHGSTDNGQSVTVDASGNVYLAGWSYAGPSIVSNVIKFPGSGGSCTAANQTGCTWVSTYDPGAGLYDYTEDVEINPAGTALFVIGRSGTFATWLRFKTVNATTGAITQNSTRTMAQLTGVASQFKSGGDVKFDSSGNLRVLLQGVDAQNTNGDAVIVLNMDQSLNLVWGSYFDDDTTSNSTDYQVGREMFIDTAQNLIYVSGGRGNLSGPNTLYVPFIVWFNNTTGAVVGSQIIGSEVVANTASQPGGGGTAIGEIPGVLYMATAKFISISDPDYELIRFGTGCSGPLSFASWTDHPTVVPGVTDIKAIHTTELRDRINTLRVNAGLATSTWTDPGLTSGGTIKKTHLDEMRTALSEVYTICSQTPPGWTDDPVTADVTVVKAAHVNELRAAVLAAP